MVRITSISMNDIDYTIVRFYCKKADITLSSFLNKLAVEQAELWLEQNGFGNDLAELRNPTNLKDIEMG